MQYVYVLNKHGEPLMPCSPGKARLLLKQQKACVVKRTPFTIKLLFGSAGYKQPITLGVDAGSKHVGLSAFGKEAKCLMLSKGIVFGIRFSTRDKSASFPVVVHREVLPSKS